MMQEVTGKTVSSDEFDSISIPAVTQEFEAQGDTQGSSALRISFKIDVPHTDGGTVRPITYFPVITTIATVAPSARAPRQTAQRFWSTAIPRCTDRRYSEFSSLRTFLVYCHPSVVVPPLPVKTIGEGMKTYLAKGDVLQLQRVALERFLNEVSQLQELLDDSAVQKFCQLPREEFVRFFDCILEKNAVRGTVMGVLPSARVFASGLVRGIAHSLSGWWTGATTGLGLEENDHREQLQRALLEMPQYRYWASKMTELKLLHSAIVDAALSAESLIGNQKALLNGIAEVGVSLGQFSDILGSAEPFEELSGSVLRCATFADGIKKQHETEASKDEIFFLEPLRHEQNWVAAALESAAEMMEIFKLHVEQTRFGVRLQCDAQREGVVAQCRSISDQLGREVDKFLLEHRSRLFRLLGSKSRTVLHFLDKERSFGEEHPFTSVRAATESTKRDTWPGSFEE